jgi:flagellar basal-body rod protein FlgC
MNSIASTALSGLQAARQRLDVAGNNIANAATAGALPAAGVGGAAASAPQRAAGGIGAPLSLVDPAIVTSYQRNSSAAGQNGLEAAPNVDLVGAVIDQKAALQAYEASAQLVRVAGRLDKTLLDSTGTKPHHSVRV